MNCSHVGCKAIGVYKVELVLYATKGQIHPAIANLDGIEVCEVHKDIYWSDVVTPDAWKLLCDTFKVKGLMPPIEHLSFVRLVPIVEVNQDV